MDTSQSNHHTLSSNSGKKKEGPCCGGCGRSHHHHHDLQEHDDGHHNCNEKEDEDCVTAGEVTVLATLLHASDWAGALARIASHPSEARVVCCAEDFRTALHVACDEDAPAVVISALLKAYPQASCKVGTSNMTPLHITCSSHHASVHVVRVLLELGLTPSSLSMRDVDGDTALHAACRCGAPIEVLKVLLRAHPTAVHERDYEGLTPLLRLWVRYFVILGDDVIQGVKSLADLEESGLQLGEAWQKTQLLLHCAHHGSLAHQNEDNNNFSLVHAASAVDCPRQVVRIAATVYPQQLVQKDKNGLTPLHIAAQAPIFKVCDLSDEGYTLEDVIHDYDETITTSTRSTDIYMSTSAASEQDESPQQPNSQQAQPSVMEFLLQATQEEASSASCLTDPLGRLPLHLALQTGKRWHMHGLQALVEAFPEAVNVLDPTCRLYPFLMAAVAMRRDDGSDGSDLDTSYELLRRNPSLLGDICCGKKKL